MSLYYRKTKANEVLETFAELYLETKGLEDDYSLEDLELPDYIRTYRGWEGESDDFWEYQADVKRQIDEIAGEKA